MNKLYINIDVFVLSISLKYVPCMW